MENGTQNNILLGVGMGINVPLESYKTSSEWG